MRLAAHGHEPQAHPAAHHLPTFARVKMDDHKDLPLVASVPLQSTW
jgi:hypothetical protein